MDNALLPYAKAIYDVAELNKSTDSWLLQLEQFAAVLTKPGISEYVQNPEVTLSTKSKLFKSWLTEAGYPKELARFVELLVLRNKLLRIAEVCTLMQSLADAANNVKRVQIVQAMPISEEKKAKIIAWLKTKLAGTVIADWQEDKYLIGGFLVKVGDTVFDYSIRAKLEQLRKIF